MELWNDVDRSLEYETRDLEKHVLSDQIDVKYTNPISIEVDNETLEASTYREVMAEFLMYVYNKDSKKLFGLQQVENFTKIIITDDPGKLHSPYEISEGLYTEGWASATTHVRNIKRIAPHFNIDLENIVITTHKERREKIKVKKVA